MIDQPSGHKRTGRPPKPLNSAILRDLALAYVARFSTSSGKLEAYLTRKLRERGWSEEGVQPDIPGIVAHYIGLGYIDDAAYAEARAGGLLRKGYGPRRVSQDLYAAGLDEDIRLAAAPDEAANRAAAVNLARRRRFGPFCREELDSPRREKQVAAMLRAGHSFDSVRAVIDASSVNAVEDWVKEARGEED